MMPIKLVHNWDSDNARGLMLVKHKDQEIARLTVFIKYDEWYIFAFSVDKSYRRRGIGSKLLRFTIKTLPTIKVPKQTCFVRLHCLPDVVPFYKHNGFYITENLWDGSYMMGYTLSNGHS